MVIVKKKTALILPFAGEIVLVVQKGEYVALSIGQLNSVLIAVIRSDSDLSPLDKPFEQLGSPLQNHQCSFQNVKKLHK